MLDRFSTKNLTRHWIRNSPINPVIENYISDLMNRGYSESTIRAYAHSVAHFSYWLSNNKIRLNRLNETIKKRFLYEHLPACDCPSPCKRSLIDVRAALEHLLEVLRSNGLIGASPRPYTKSLGEELKRYDAYLRDVCGLASNTRISRIQHAREFLRYRFGRYPIAVSRITSNDIQRFILRYGEGYKVGTVQVVCCAVRSYLRFRALGGDATTTLIAAVPSVAQWRLSTLPKALAPNDVERLLNTFDRSTPTGLRGYAIARCLADLGMRASEVARIQLDDVNWREGTLQIKGKGGRVDILPLPVKTGEALVNYLRRGRPATQSRALFVRHRAPFDLPVGPSIVRSAMRPAFAHCNLNPGMGTHVLRHTAASRMLAAGASLKEIADILRHRNLDTTTIYTKIDLSRLAPLAASWPGRSS
jgi:integrase/recombinase XerD